MINLETPKKIRPLDRAGPPGRDEHAAAHLPQVRRGRARVPQGARHARRDDRRHLRVGSDRGAGAAGVRREREARGEDAGTRTAPTSPPCSPSWRCAGATSACCSRCRARAWATPRSPRSPTTSSSSGSTAPGPRWRSPSRAPARTPPTSGPPRARTATSTSSTARRSTSPRASAPTASSSGRPWTRAWAAPRSSRSSSRRARPACSVERLEHKLGIRASDTAAISFDDCRVPAENLLGSPDVDTKQGFAGAMATFDNTRPLVAAMAVGCARASLDLTREILEEAGVRDRLRRAGAHPVGGGSDLPAAGGGLGGGVPADPAVRLDGRQPQAELDAGLDGEGQGRPGRLRRHAAAASSWPARSATPSSSCSRSGAATPRSSTSSRAPSRSSS